jgi:hypothetical protein
VNFSVGNSPLRVFGIIDDDARTDVLICSGLYSGGQFDVDVSLIDAGLAVPGARTLSLYVIDLSGAISDGSNVSFEVIGATATQSATPPPSETPRATPFATLCPDGSSESVWPVSLVPNSLDANFDLDGVAGTHYDQTNGIHTLLSIDGFDGEVWQQQPLSIGGVELITHLSNLTTGAAKVAFTLMNHDSVSHVYNLAVFGSFVENSPYFSFTLEPVPHGVFPLKHIFSDTFRLEFHSGYSEFVTECDSSWWGSVDQLLANIWNDDIDVSTLWVDDHLSFSLSWQR